MHMKVVSLSELRTGRLKEISLVLISARRLSPPQDHNAVGRIKSMKYLYNPIKNRTRKLPACSTVPQSTTPPRALIGLTCLLKIPTRNTLGSSATLC